MILRHIYCVLLITLVGGMGCQSTRQTSKFGLTESFYTSRSSAEAPKLVYIIPGEDSILMYAAGKAGERRVDTTESSMIYFPSIKKRAESNEYLLKQNTFDIDFLSILLKYRPAIKGFPNQLNTSILNGAVYLGHRTDLFHIRYNQTPFDTYKREITHYGFSFGIFTGIGATRIDEYVTQNALTIQYDGLVNPSGVAAILALNKLSFGLTFGVDHLLDKNRKLWIYQGKPWMGLSVGLNLN